MNRSFIHPTLSTDVPSDIQVHLARAAEEASELVKEAMKALRFGLGNRYPANDPTNREKIVTEFHDVEAALMDAGLIPSTSAHARHLEETRHLLLKIAGFLKLAEIGAGSPDEAAELIQQIADYVT